MTPGADVLRLPPGMADAIVAHAREASPRECCGVIGGSGGDLHELRRVANAHPGLDFYTMDDTALFKTYREFDGRGWEFAVIYHSHPTSAAFPSSSDVALAAWPDACYVICSLEAPDWPSLRGFRIVDGVVSEVLIVA
ncbi:MAG: Mov34/MPN/PAD-1 family protein [Thermomicrobiales bacterium]